MSSDFYKELKPFHRFSEATDRKHYEELPDDWVVIVTDVSGSTKAIEQGRYKDVNMLGAACIIATVNRCGDLKFPFVFGGDGATMLLPESHANEAIEELLALRTHAQRALNLGLRVGLVPMSEIKKRNKTIRVAKYELPTGQPLAMFRGGGANLADDLVKNGGFERHETSNKEPDLTGLSCRWQPITSKHDHILTLLVMNMGEEGKRLGPSYDEINQKINTIIDTDISNPVSPETIHYKWPIGSVAREAALVWNKSNRFFIKCYLNLFTLLFFLMHHLNCGIGSFSIKKYRKDMITNSDYRKFDDMLRMVVDCTKEQAGDVEAYLKSLHNKGYIAFGTHYSDTALMTCFFQSPDSDGHVHFVDGNDGGYALAAKQLKQQLSDYAIAS